MRKNTLILIFIIMSLFFIPISVNAQDIEVVSGSDEEGTYFYKFGDGTFNTNLQPGCMAELAYFEWDDKLNISLIKDGNNYNYEMNDFIIESGHYVAVIYNLNTDEMDKFIFDISNDININALNQLSETLSDDQTLNSNQNSENKEESDNNYSENSSELTLNDLENKLELTDSDTYIDDLETSLTSISTLEKMFDTVSENSIKNIDMSFKYSEDDNMLLYSTDLGYVLKASIPNNMTVSEKVKLYSVGDGIIYIFKDGEIISETEDKCYSDPGYYDVVSYIYDMTGKTNNGRAVIYEAHFSFNIVEHFNSNIGVVNAPSGFHFIKICHNGIAVELPKYGDYFLEGDGLYQFDLEADDGSFVYHYQFDRDSAAPFLNFSKDVSVSKIKAPISYTKCEEDSEVESYIDQHGYYLEEGKDYYASGVYSVTVTDQNGNSRNYTFYVKGQYNFFSKGMIMLIGITFVFIILFMLVKRNGEYKV